MTMAWWQSGVIYQIYPRSFQDTDGDGSGDLAGVRRRLDYLAQLGVDAIWLTPFYKSPMYDGGYDVSDYCSVDPLFGSLADFDALLKDAYARGLKVILDFVPNHTSHLHPWFIESSSSRNNPKRDWYIWRDAAADGGPPNNWMSHFGGSAWSRDETTGQYYYHAFLAEQPDLNWRNPQLRAAMCDVLRFWLRRGVDGFRVDVASHLIKDALFRDNPPNPDWRPGAPDMTRLRQVHSADQPETHDIISQFRRIIDEFDNRVLIGEMYLPLDRLVSYYGANLDELHLPFNFQLLDARWRAADIGRIIESYEDLLPHGAWPNWVLSNHDRPRIAARVGAAQARVAIMLLLTLRGTPTFYYGDEIGLAHVPVSAAQIRDTWARREAGPLVGRDPGRTPMQWDGGAYAGFSTHAPWLPLTDDFRERNVAVMTADRNSVLNLVKNLLRLRRAHPALSAGRLALLDAEDDVLAYERTIDNERLVVVLNLSDAPRQWRMREAPMRVLISTLGGGASAAPGPVIDLRPNEGLVLG